MMLTATTNNAINNAIEKTAQLRPNYPIIRDMSYHGEEGVSEVVKKYVLRTRCEEPLPDEQFLGEEELLKDKLKFAIFEYQAAKKLFEDTTLDPVKRLSILELIKDINSILKRTYLQAAVPFVLSSTPSILNRHGRHTDPTETYTIRGHSASSSFSHLIVDEASQVPSYMALSLYCSFPDLERITIIGDCKQLGPHCQLEKQKEANLFELLTQSELDRVTRPEMLGTPTCKLLYNYRCHPEITKKLLYPIYKEDLRSGLSESQRRLHITHSLPASKSNSRPTVHSQLYPIRFFNVPVNGDDGYNVWEKNEVINLLKDLLMNAQPAHRLSRKDIAVLCFHKRQRAAVAINKYIPDLSESKDKITVATIDSYQGKENKVILVCTIKTCPRAESVNLKLKFVADSRRCTVALSRAQEAIYIFGQWEMLIQTPFWAEYKNLISDGFMVSTAGTLHL